MIFQDCWNMIVNPKWHFINVFPYFSLNWAVCEPVKMRTMWFEFWSHPVHALVEGAMCTGWSALAGTDAPVYLSITGCRPDGCSVWWWTSCRTPALSPQLPTLVICSESELAVGTNRDGNCKEFHVIFHVPFFFFLAILRQQEQFISYFLS